MKSLQEKALLFALLGVAVTLLYFGTLHSTLFDATPVLVTALDRAIPFVGSFIVPYLSFFLLILLPLFVISDPQELRDVAFGFALIVVASSLVFLLWPTSVSITNTNPLVRSLLALDLQRNACPSLHASLALYCALCARRSLRTAFARHALWIWTILVMASALLIKRHVAIDIAAGAAFGCTVYVILFRPLPVEAPDSEPVLETLRIRSLLAQVAADDFHELIRHDGRKRAEEFAVFVTVAALGFSLSVWARSLDSMPTLVLGILVTAVALNSFPLLMHEGMHGVLFPNHYWNWMVSVLLGSTFLMSFSSYRVLHMRHHRYLGDPRDPDDYHNYSRSRAMVWFLHFVRLTFGPLLYLILIPLFALRYGSSAQRKLICIEYTILFSIYSVLFRMFPARELLLVWFVPLLLMGMFTAIRGFTQHGITEATDPYLASRTMLPNPVIAFFLMNENYHLEHHLFPEIPSYRLRRLHQMIWPKLPRAVSGKSYLAFLAAFLRATPRMDETPIGLVNPGELP
jgi:fatty acid desaturase/membrane-associated phospholipid phosphatase